MIGEFKAFFSAFQQGKLLANSATWKNRQMATGALTALLGAGLVIARGFGYGIEIDSETLAALAGGIAAVYGVFNAVLTAVTSAKVGVPASGAPDAES